MKTAYLALGSNLGDRLAFLSDAVRRLERPGELRVDRLSSVYESAPVGITDQPDFLNMVVQIKTRLTPQGLLEACLAFEVALGRVRRERWGPRTLDADVLWYEANHFATPALTLPHPRMLERAFVLVPLAEIAPDLTIDGKRVIDLAALLGGVDLKNVGKLPWTPSVQA